MPRHYLASLFEPASVAIIGATQRKGAVGRVLMENMVEARFAGELYAVNPKHRKVLGVPCFPSVARLPKRVDLAVVVTRAEIAPAIIEECGVSGIPSAVVISAGFSEAGPRGAELEAALLASARKHGVRLIGPNCLGIMRPALGLNATFGRGNARGGSLALVSQSGAISAAMLDWARPNGIGFSSVISLGGSADIDFGEIVDYLTGDVATEHILLYIEGIHDARRFISAMRAAARAKPVVVMKSGRHPSGARAAVSHTGAMVGADDVFDAALKRTGAVRVSTIGQHVAAAHALSTRVRPRGERLAIVTNGGGPGVLAADRATELGVPLAALSAATAEVLKLALPSNWSQGNPVDVMGDADDARYKAAVSACLADPGVDGVLVILTPQAMTSAVDIARAVIGCAKQSDKPLLTVWMGEEQVQKARALLQERHIPVFRTPEPAVDMFSHVSSFYRNQRQLMEVPGPLGEHAAPELDRARAIVAEALANGTRVLSSSASKALLAAFHIPVAPALPARAREETDGAADPIAHPVVIEADSADATTETMLRRDHRRALFVGVLTDRVFGPAITFGSGGAALEVHADRVVGLPPLNTFLAAEMIGSTRIARMLGPFRGMPPANLAAIQSVLLRVSEMVCELPELHELDIDPLLADENGVIAADARAVIAPAQPGARPYAHMAIHPYPVHLVTEWKAADGTRVVVRPIRPEDAQIEREFVAALSPEARYLRFMGSLKALTPAMLARFTQVDYDREMALIGVVQHQGTERQVGVARYVTYPDGVSCEFAIVVAEDWQGRGLARHLMLRLMAIARERGLATMIGQVLVGNKRMLDLAAALGFVAHDSAADPSLAEVRVRLA